MEILPRVRSSSEIYGLMVSVHELVYPGFVDFQFLISNECVHF